MRKLITCSCLTDHVFQAGLAGGEGGIRTLEGFNTLPAFQASALDQLCDLSVFKMVCNLHSILDFQKHSVPNVVILCSLFVNWQN